MQSVSNKRPHRVLILFGSHARTQILTSPDFCLGRAGLYSSRHLLKQRGSLNMCWIRPDPIYLVPVSSVWLSTSWPSSPVWSYTGGIKIIASLLSPGSSKLVFCRSNSSPLAYINISKTRPTLSLTSYTMDNTHALRRASLKINQLSWVSLPFRAASHAQQILLAIKSLWLLQWEQPLSIALNQ